MKERQKLMFNRKYDKEETPNERLNRYRSRNRKLEKENKRLKSELLVVERELRKSLSRIEELTSDIDLEVLLGTEEEETEGFEDFSDTEVAERESLLGQTSGSNRED